MGPSSLERQGNPRWGCLSLAQAAASCLPHSALLATPPRLSYPALTSLPSTLHTLHPGPLSASASGWELLCIPTLPALASGVRDWVSYGPGGHLRWWGCYSERTEVWGFRGPAVFVGWVQAVEGGGSTAPGVLPFRQHKEGTGETAGAQGPRGSSSLFRQTSGSKSWGRAWGSCASACCPLVLVSFHLSSFLL